MDASNLKKLLNELTDIIYIERKIVFSFIGFALFVKLSFFFLHQRDTEESQELILAQIEKDGDKDIEAKINHRSASERLFPFNPATASYEDLIDLGFSPLLARRLINYRNKGGQFRTKEDVKKIYDLPLNFYLRIEPYIICNPIQTNHENGFHKSVKTPTIIDINSASIEEFKSLPGIGDYFAKKIIEKRTRLGAFIDIDQIAEIYRFPDTTFQKIKPFLTLRPAQIKKININRASEEELKNHPYILRWQAEDILKHRPIYGLDDLYDLNSFSDKSKNKYVGSYFDF